MYGNLYMKSEGHRWFLAGVLSWRVKQFHIYALYICNALKNGNCTSHHVWKISVPCSPRKYINDPRKSKRGLDDVNGLCINQLKGEYGVSIDQYT